MNLAEKWDMKNHYMQKEKAAVKFHISYKCKLTIALTLAVAMVLKYESWAFEKSTKPHQNQKC